MNYLSHARNHLERPYALAGTSLPDWMAVSDRRHRIRPGDVAPPDPADRSPQAEVLRGMHAHFEDDAWFHRTAAFEQVSGTLTRRIRATFPDRPRLRASFFGHVLLEMLLDACLAKAQPGTLDVYYAGLDGLDVDRVLAVVRAHTQHSARRLEVLIDRFRSSEFLRTYADDGAVAERLNEVGRRLRQPPLPDGFVHVVTWARAHVREHAPALLTRVSA